MVSGQLKDQLECEMTFSLIKHTLKQVNTFDDVSWTVSCCVQPGRGRPSGTRPGEGDVRDHLNRKPTNRDFSASSGLVEVKYLYLVFSSSKLTSCLD